MDLRLFTQIISIAYLEVTTTRIINMLDLQSKKGGEIQVLSVITKPFTSLIVQVRFFLIQNSSSLSDKDIVKGMKYGVNLFVFLNRLTKK